MKLIINCDDFGLAYSFTEATKNSYLKGIATSTSIRTNGPAYKYAASLLKGKLKRIGLGLHLNLTDGRTKTEGLANEDSYYKFDFLKLSNPLLKKEKGLVKVIEKDLRSQFEQLLSDGLTPDHVDSEKHVHMIPWIFEIVCKLCREFKTESIRFSRESYYLTDSLFTSIRPLVNFNLMKLLILDWYANKNYQMLKKYRLKTTDGFYGVLQTNNMTTAIIESIVKHALYNSFKTVEICIHPGYPNDERDKDYTSEQIAKYANLPNRLLEANTLEDKELKRFLKEKKVDLVSYNDLA